LQGAPSLRKGLPGPGLGLLGVAEGLDGQTPQKTACKQPR
jgi:hypothetical protein